VLAALAILVFMTKTGTMFSRQWIGTWSILSFAVLAIYRIGLRNVLRQARKRGYNQRHIVIVGAGKLGTEVARRIKLAPWTGLHVAAFFDDNVAREGELIEGVELLGHIDKLNDYVELKRVDQVWLTLPMRAEDRAKEVLEQLVHSTAEIRFVPDIYNFQLLNHSMTEVAGLPVINLTESPMNGVNAVIKAAEDILLASIILLLISPLLLLIAIGVKLSSRGPILYFQERVTWNNERFRIIKFRTMPVDAEAKSGAVWAKEGEDRATKFGAFLRRFSLDELPQFINVLRGEMSIVGPRPERPALIEQFRSQIPGYMQKHLVKAGITGWAQVNDLRGNSDLAKRIEYDLFYIENWSLWFDLRIIALTAIKMVFSKNAY
jgi:putative colanic acid biosysnthesis UDP-glucose lipid carrier transferase